MARITIEDCLEKTDTRFALVLLAVKRVRQLGKSSKPLVNCNNEKIVTALREIASGKVSIKEENTINENQIDNTINDTES